MRERPSEGRSTEYRIVSDADLELASQSCSRQAQKNEGLYVAGLHCSLAPTSSVPAAPDVNVFLPDHPHDTWTGILMTSDRVDGSYYCKVVRIGLENSSTQQINKGPGHMRLRISIRHNGVDSQHPNPRMERPNKALDTCASKFRRCVTAIASASHSPCTVCPVGSGRENGCSGLLLPVSSATRSRVSLGCQAWSGRMEQNCIFLHVGPFAFCFMVTRASIQPSWRHFKRSNS